MSEQKENFDLKELDENIQVYDNDDAYIFGELKGNNYNEYMQDNNQINNIFNTNNIITNEQISKNKNNNEVFNKLNLNYINKEENQKDNEYNNNQNINSNKNSKNIINIQDITFNKKYSINDIDSDLDNEKNPFKVEKKKKKNENQINNANDNNVINNNNNENDNIEDSNDSNIPLVTLNFLSICQCCKDPFNSKDCIPYLFKCGHFFCKKCIVEQFIDEEGIKCPNDGLVAKSISELKILNNFITDKTVTQRTSNSNSIYCNIHKGQKMTHYIEENKELICIYCAFEKFKQNPNWEIKEINDKIKEIEIEIDNIIEENQKNVGIIQNTLNEIKKNKEVEEKKVIEVFDRLYEIIKDKKEDNLNKINTLFKENARKLSQKLELFSNKIEKSEEIKEKINLYNENKEQNQLSGILNDYNKLLNKINDNHYYKLVLQKYKFIYDDEPIIVRLINKFGDFKIIPNNCAFIGIKKNNINNNSNINNNNNFKDNLNYNHSTSKLNINQSQSGMNINIFTNINNQDNTSSAINEPINNIIKQKLKNNKSYSSISPFQKNKKKINNISNSQYNSFYKQKMIDSNISENKSNINSINIYKNYKNNSKLKTTSKKKKLNNTLDFDINIRNSKNINNSTPGLRVNTPSDLIKKNILNNGVHLGNKNKTFNNFYNNHEKKSNKFINKPNCLKSNLNIKKNNK